MTPVLVMLALFAASQGSAVDKRLELYRWIDTLGYDELLHGEFVSVDERSTLPDGTKSGEWIKYGFLIRSSPLTMTTTDLHTTAFPEHGTHWTLADHATYKPLDLATYLPQAWTQAERQIKPDWTLTPETYKVSIDPLRLVVLSRAAEGRGLTELSKRTYGAAERLSAHWHRDEKPFADSIKEFAATSEFYRCWRNFGEITVSRAQLLQDFQRYLSLFPNGKDAPMARQIVASLTEYPSRSIPTPDELAKMPLEKRISELIYDLQDQSGSQFMNPGDCDVFDDPRGDASPAGQLLKIGYAAVPQLTAALHDQRLTRSMRQRGNGPYGEVLRVGEVAHQVRMRIRSG